VDPQPHLRPPRYADLYETLWVSWGATRLGDIISDNYALAYAGRFFDREDGGFYSSIATGGRAREKDLRSTALGGIALAVAGDFDRAAVAGEFVIDLLAMQSNPERAFFFVRQDDRGLVKKFDPELERYFVIHRGQARPLYYALGLGVAFLALLARELGDVRYARCAEKYLEVYAAHGSDITRHQYAGKLAWGLSMLHSVTGKRGYAELAAETGDYLCQIQGAAGEWVVAEASGGVDGIYDRTSEYSIWLRYLSARE